MEVKASNCTSCGAIHDAANVVNMHGEIPRTRRFSVGDNVMPKPGDFSVCIKCGHVMGWADDGTLRDLTVVEVYKIAGDPRLIAIQRARSKVRK